MSTGPPMATTLEVSVSTGGPVAAAAAAAALLLLLLLLPPPPLPLALVTPPMMAL